jgi:anaerobic magnesium-protoporphyrin IX monomethyl ester cyclase
MANDLIFLMNYRNERDMYPPFGLMYVADALLQIGFRVEIFHETHDYVDAFIRRVEAERPLFVGLSTITGPQLKPVIDTSVRLKALGTPVVWGGVHATIMPEEVLKEDYVDFVVINEGEETIQELARMLAGQIPTDYTAVRGLAWKDASPGGLLPGNLLAQVKPTDKGYQIVINPERPFIQDLDRFRPRWDLIPVERYLIQSGPYDRALPVYISRGCPFRCGFCYNEVVMKRTWRQHSDEFILEQVKWLRDHYQINAVDYADDYLFGRIKPMQRLVEKVGMPWSGQVRVQLLKPEFVHWMKDTGCQWVNIGAESGSQAVLDSMHKDQKAEQIEWGVRNLVEIAPHIEANLSFIVGLPDENEVERKVTFDLIERLAAMSPKARCSVCVYMPYPGTPLWPEALARGYVPPDNQAGWCEFDLNRGNTPWVSDAEAQVMSEINDILFVGRSTGHWLLAPYYGLLRWRWRNMYFRHYWEGRFKHFLLRTPLRRALDWIVRNWVDYNPITHKGPVAERGAAGD